MTYRQALRITLSQLAALALLSLTLLYPNLTRADIVINEFVASNASTIADEAGAFDDWVELYNTGATPVDIGGWYMSDDLTAPQDWQIPATDPALTTIQPGGFLLLWFDKEPEQGPLHIDAKLGSDGEDIVLHDGNAIVDSYTFGPQISDVSEGRIPDGTGTFRALASATPEAANDDSEPPTAAEAVKFSIPGGPYAGNQTVELSSATTSATIYYTTDGTDPDIDAIEYTNPISINSSTPIRAIATRSDLTASDITTNTYIIDSNHDFIIIAASGDPALYYDPDIGMIPNFEEDIEVPVNVEIYDNDGTQMINQMAETEIQGSFSARYVQKSFAYKAKASLGKDSFDYPLFPDEDMSEYLSIVGRNSGGDFNHSMFHDAFVSSLVRDLSDVDGVIRKSDIDMQAYRPAVTYINGEYYGIHNLRERADRRYIEAHYGLSRDEIILIEKVFEVKEGTWGPWGEFRNFLEDNDMSIQANADELAERMDIQSFIDYNVFLIFADATDWPGNNIRTWRPIEEGGKWRWLMYDLDQTYGINTKTDSWGSGNPSQKTLSRMLVVDPEFDSVAKQWAIEFFQSMMENEGFRNQFLNRLADEMNTLYKPSRVLTRLDEFYQLYNTGANERQQHADRWDGTTAEYNHPQWNTTQKILDAIDTFTTGGEDYPQGRIGYMIEDVLDNYSDIDAAVSLNINTQPAGSGFVNLNSLSLSGAALPFSGTYFTDIAIPVSAKAARGFFFDGWSDSNLGTNESGELTLTGNTTLTASFTQGSTSTVGIIISEINYNSADDVDSEDWVELYNPTANPVDISGWWLNDESEDYFGLPANTIIPANGTLVLAADLTAFSTIYPQVTNVIGSFGEDPGGFGLSGKGEHVFLYNAAGTLIDDVNFDDKDPWPESPDGDGPTLQLVDPAADNALPQSWVGEVATPGVYQVSNGPDQTITLGAIADKTVLDSAFTVSGSASSGLPVSYSVVSGPAIILGDQITLTGVTGTVVIAANQAGDTNFNPAPEVQTSFEVTTATQSISFGQLADLFNNATPFSLSATASSNLPVSYSVVSGPATVSGNVVSLTGDTGTVVIRASQSGDANYAAASNVDRSFDVIPFVVQDYCDAKANKPWNSWISGVNLTDLAHQLPKKNQYGDYTDESSTMQLGSTNPMTITASLSWVTGAMHYKVWIDYNQNGVFEEGPETALYVVNPAPVLGAPADIATGNIVIPATASSGSTRMRISLARDEEPTPCGTHELGEVSDFTVNLAGTVTPEITLSCPDDINAEVIAPNNSLAVSWSAPASGTTCPSAGLSVSQTAGASSGSVLATGTETISYSASDSCGNTKTCSFNVNVTQSAATLTYSSCPADVNVSSSNGSDAAAQWNTPAIDSNCPAGGTTSSQTTGNPSGSSFALGTHPIVYAATDQCGNTTTCNFDVNVTTGPVGPVEYCDAKALKPWNAWISGVTLSELNHQLPKKNQYGDYTDEIATLTRGTTEQLDITASLSWISEALHYEVWIDFNQNGVFESSENVLSVANPETIMGAPSDSVSQTISIPANAVPGSTRMRVSMQWNQAPTPCDTHEYGEVSDFGIVIE